jgi:hypothetical protein
METHYVSATEPNRLMLFGETVAVYCENHTEHINTLCGHFSPYLTANTLRFITEHTDAMWQLPYIPVDTGTDDATRASETPNAYRRAGRKVAHGLPLRAPSWVVSASQFRIPVPVHSRYNN